ncbi:glycosyltransferase [Microbacterium rhizophilus]|uniref:glycosyltransferase n=1 Tax=Microbacterium rhizophilus TaxID=3138934 RepID=UPI0031F14E8D
MKTLFLTADLGGNVPPALAVAEELARRGMDVEVAGLSGARTTLPQPPFPAATGIKPEGREQGPRELRAALRLMTSRATSAATSALVAERRADAVVVDCILPAVIRGALDTGAPVVVLFHTFGAYWARWFDRGPAGAAFRLLGVSPRAVWAEAAERLLLTDPELDPGRDDPALAGATWTGTTEVGVEPGPRGDRPRVLVALSSTQWPGMLSVYRRIVAALAGLPVDAVVTTGGVPLGGELPGAANVDVRGWVDHRELLPMVDLVIGHGGHSTTFKALAHGVPLLILPVNPTADQRLIGGVIEDAGLGRRLPKSARTETIRAAASEILADRGIRARAEGTGRRLRSQPPGALVAADRIAAMLDRSG